ncbi:MAG: phage tail protein, partial [Paracoccus sp. (in: a-proteobacteria)]|uniref:phage tail protein n=1 Tax=Paracoccus sp. TaxID=267 RepID=UPI0026E07729
MIFPALIAVLICLIAAPAHAGPVVAAVAAISSWKVAGFAIGATLLQAGASFALSALSRALMRKNAPPPAGLRSNVTTSGDNTPQNIILGKYATAGNMVCPPMTHGQDGKTPNAYLTYVVDLADMPLASLDAVWVDDERVIPTGTPDAEGFRRLGGRYSATARIKFYDGRQTAADPYLLDRYGRDPDRPWRADMIGRGIAYAIVEFKLDRDLYKGFPRLLFEVTGSALYDPRRDSSAGGSGSQRWDNPATWRPSENPAVQVYNILRGITLDDYTRWGGTVDPVDLPLDNWRAAMSACDVQVDGEASYRTSYEIRVGPEDLGGDAPADIIDEILRGSCGQIMEYGGVWKLRMGGVGLPVMVLTDDDLLITEDHQYRPFLSLSETKNAVHAQYPEPAERWVAKEAPPRYAPDFETLDQGRRLIASVNLPATPYPAQVQRMMKFMLAEERRFAHHDLPLPPDFAALEPLDAVAWTSARNGYTNKVFEIGGKSDDLRSMIQRVTLRERDAADVAWRPSDLLPSAPVPIRRLPLAPQMVPGWNAVGDAVKDRAGASRRPAVRLTWENDLPDVAAILWEIRVKGRTDLAAKGTAHDVAAGGVLVTQGILP